MKREFKVGIEVVDKDNNKMAVEDIYYSGEFDCDVVQCSNGKQYFNDEMCEINIIK